MLLVHGQHLLAEIKQGPDGVQATWMLPVVTGTDLVSFKQKENLWQSTGVSEAPSSLQGQIWRADRNRGSSKRPRTIKHNPDL